MSYTKHNFTGGSILTASQLNDMDDQIAANETAIQGKQATLTFDTEPTEDSTNPVTSGSVFTALAGKQGTLTLDSAPTENSTNPVTSGGTYTALSGKASSADLETLRDAIYPVGIIILGDTLPVDFGTWTEVSIGITDTKTWKRTA